MHHLPSATPPSLYPPSLPVVSSSAISTQSPHAPTPCRAYKTLNLDFPAIKELYASMEFVGISAYTALPPGAPVSDLELSLIYHDVELSLKGVRRWAGLG